MQYDAAEHRTRTEALTGRIRADIVGNVLPPGLRLTEKGLARRYEMSRTPVREALRTLAREALLEYAPNAGYRVARLALADLDDLYTLRIAVERECVRRLASGGGDLGVVRALLEVWAAGPQAAPDPEGSLVAADEGFHEALAAATGGTVLVQTLRNINRRIHSLRVREFLDPVRVMRTYEQHAAILRAILDRAGDLADALMAAHILEGHRFVRAFALAHGLVEHEGLDRPPAGAPPAAVWAEAGA